jgi:threonine dehydrogenase-like Zn-dependent dehydrogenase
MKALSIDRPGSGAARRSAASRWPVPVEVLLQVAFAGLCGTDLSTFLGKNPTSSIRGVIGHEISGAVVETGPGVSAGTWRGVSRRLSVPTRTAGCARRAGSAGPTRAASNETLGVQRDGALAEYAAVPASRLVPSPQPAARCARAGRAVFSIACTPYVGTEVTSSDTVARARLWRGSAQAPIAAASALGASGHRIGHRRAEARAGPSSRRRRGGRRPGRCDRAGARAHGGDGPSVVIEAVGSPATYRLALELVAPCGRIGCVGWLKGDVPLEAG